MVIIFCLWSDHWSWLLFLLPIFLLLWLSLLGQDYISWLLLLKQLLVILLSGSLIVSHLLVNKIQITINTYLLLPCQLFLILHYYINHLVTVPLTTHNILLNFICLLLLTLLLLFLFNFNKRPLFHLLNIQPPTLFIFVLNYILILLLTLLLYWIATRNAIISLDNLLWSCQIISYLPLYLWVAIMNDVLDYVKLDSISSLLLFNLTVKVLLLLLLIFLHYLYFLNSNFSFNFIYPSLRLLFCNLSHI